MPRLSRHRRRILAARFTGVVLALQLGTLVMLAVTPGPGAWAGSGAPGGWFLGLLWAWGRQPSFYPLVALGLAGPVLTWWAARVRGVHRWWLLAGWAGFLTLVNTVYFGQVELMLRVLRWRVM